MDDKEFALNVIWENYIDVIKINVVSGSYKFLKTPDTFTEFSDIFTFFENSENLSQIYANDLSEYKAFIARKTLITNIFESARNTINYRRIVDNQYHWVTSEIVRSADFSLQNPIVILTTKLADEKICNENTAVRELNFDFHKILQVDLFFDTYSIVKIRDGEIPKSEGAKKFLSQWLIEIVEDGTVHNDDIDVFKRMTEVDYMRRYFLEKRGNLRIRYRRMSNGEFRWVVFEAVPSPDFTLQNQNIMIYVRDIEDEYAEQMHRQKSLEKISFEDSLTGLQNRTAYNQALIAVNKRTSGSCGVIFSDLNGLKYMNDNFGHAAGDKYLCSFADFLKKSFRTNSCYRIGGDEFVTIIQDSTEVEFNARTQSFISCAEALKDTSVSVGSAFGILPHSLEDLVERAEQAMYAAKAKYHKEHPEIVRK